MNGCVGSTHEWAGFTFSMLHANVFLHDYWWIIVLVPSFFASVVNPESGKSFHGMMGLFYFEFSIMLATQSKLIEIHFTEISLIRNAVALPLPQMKIHRDYNSTIHLISILLHLKKHILHDHDPNTHTLIIKSPTCFVRTKPGGSVVITKPLYREG